MIVNLKQAYSFTQAGSRPNQEDSRYPDCDMPERGQHFFVVCDGVGGSEKGELASRTVCDAFGSALAGFDWQREFTAADFERALDSAFASLESILTPENRDMATTLTFVAFHAGGCFIAHIGDSRVYYVRPGEGIVYRTDDHSLVNALVRAGVITEDEAATHPDRNVITRSVCVPDADHERSAATTANIADVRSGDYVLLCTDGVLKRLADDAIVDILSSDSSDAAKCAHIAAMSVDSDDNNTAILVGVDSVEGAAATAGTHPIAAVETRPRRRMPLSAIIGIIVAVVLVVVIALMAVKLLKADDDRKKEADAEQTELAAHKATVPPRFDGNMQEFINKNLKYPSETQATGTVEVRFSVKTDGTTAGLKVTKSVDAAIDKEALRLCSLMHFVPAKDGDGNAVEAVTSQQIVFRRPAASETKAENPKTRKEQTVGQDDDDEAGDKQINDALKRRQEEQKRLKEERLRLQKEAAERRHIEQLTGQPLQSI